MNKKGFDSDLYIEMQIDQIKEKLKLPGDKFYIEIGGKLIHDRHAARVLPGFREDARFEVVSKLATGDNIIVVVSSKDIVRKRMRGDFKITYDKETIRTINELRVRGLSVRNVVITMIDEGEEVPKQIVDFEKELLGEGLHTYRYFDSDQYRSGKLKKEDFDKNPYIEISSKHVLVIAPGGGSGKFGVCLNELYHEMIRGNSPKYFSLGAFPLYDLPMKHPLNLSYMAASADFKDMLSGDPNLVDSVLTKREIKNYELLRQLADSFKKEGKHLRDIKSATEMCVSALSRGIVDFEEVEKEAAAEIARRCVRYKYEVERGEEKQETVDWTKKILSML